MYGKRNRLNEVLCIRASIRETKWLTFRFFSAISAKISSLNGRLLGTPGSFFATMIDGNEFKTHAEKKARVRHSERGDEMRTWKSFVWKKNLKNTFVFSRIFLHLPLYFPVMFSHLREQTWYKMEGAHFDKRCCLLPVMPKKNALVHLQWTSRLDCLIVGFRNELHEQENQSINQSTDFIHKHSSFPFPSENN